MERPTHDQVSSLEHLLIPMADDEWMIGHRGSEWLALAPDLEEDLALSSTSQDEMGHAKLLYELLEELGQPSADERIFSRDASHWHHAALTTRPRQGWAEWSVRRYFYEVFDQIRRSALSHVPYPPLVAALRKMDREEVYHVAHQRSVMAAMAYGGSESFGYLNEAVADVWPLLPDLFEWTGPDEHWVVWDAGVLAPSAMRGQFEATVRQDFHKWGLSWPGDIGPARREARHHDNSAELEALLTEMRSVRTIAPASAW